jgi:hypothetical protein
MADNDRERMEKEFEDRLTWKMGDPILIHPGYGPKTFAEMEAEEIAQEEAERKAAVAGYQNDKNEKL